MFAVIVNTLAVLFGSGLGLLGKRGIPEKASGAVMIGMGLATVYIGIIGLPQGGETLVVVISLVLGGALGALLNIQGFLDGLGARLQARLSRSGETDSSFAQGFVTASLLFCVGAMSIVGSFNAGLTGDYAMLYTKSIMDLISSCMLAASLGAGVMAAALAVLTYQGGLVLLAGALEPLLSPAMISQLTCVGSLLILALGFNLLGIAKLKVADYLPALIFAPLVYAAMTLLGLV